MKHLLECIELSCEGACEKHVGPARLVHVINGKSGHDWGLFAYCDVAIRCDLDNGFLVTSVVRLPGNGFTIWMR